MNIKAKEIFGAEIDYFRLDPEFWDCIVKSLAETGLRMVTTYIPWECHMVKEPDAEHPLGYLDFTGETNPRLNLMYFLEIVEKYGLDMNFRCGPFCCNELDYGGYPKFLVTEMTDIFALNNEDKPTKGYEIATKGSHQPSYLHPVYLDYCEKWIGEMSKIIYPHLKVNGGCITMINLDNEVSYIVQDSFLQSDYNPVNVAPGGYYHQFLKEKYGTVEKLPYRTKYAAFEEIPAPRSVPENVDDDYAYYADWMEFHTWVMCRYIEKLREMYEANGITTEKVTFMTNYDPHLPEGIPTRMPDFEKATGGVTGYDFYRSAFMTYSGYQSMARVMKLMNNTLCFPFSSEFMAGIWEKILSSRISDDHMRFMARCALAHGCKAIQWFMFHDRDSWNDAPVSSHGQKRPSIDVLTEIPKILFEKIQNWDTMKPINDIGIVYDLTTHIHTSLGDPMPCADGNMHMGIPKIDGVEAGWGSKEYVGMFRLAEQNGVQAAAIDIHYDDAPLYEYPLIVYPGSPVIAAKTEEQLLKYVQNGGVLAITGVVPTRYAHGEKCNFFGGIEKGEQTVGKGRVIFVDKYIGQADADEDSLENIALFGDLLKAANVVAAVRVSAKPCVWKALTGAGMKEFVKEQMHGSAVLHQSNGETILFLLNHYPEAHKFTLEFSIPCTKLVCLTEEQDVMVENGVCTIDIDRKNCQIYRVE